MGSLESPERQDEDGGTKKGAWRNSAPNFPNLAKDTTTESRGWNHAKKNKLKIIQTKTHHSQTYKLKTKKNMWKFIDRKKVLPIGENNSSEFISKNYGDQKQNKTKKNRVAKHFYTERTALPI